MRSRFQVFSLAGWVMWGLIGSSFGSQSNFACADDQAREVVVTYHDLATQVGEKILHSGGNAFDAFVASTLVQYVLSEGVTSPAGPLHALLYDAKSKEVVFLDGWLNNVKNPDGNWSAADPNSGKAVVVPGAIRALELLSKRYGKLPFSECVRPAFEIAKNGFPLSDNYAYLINYRKELLQKSEYGKRTYFKDGKPLQVGSLLKLPEFADFLSHLMTDGADYMYKGDWAKKAVQLVQSLGGKMTLEDLSSYQARWLKPFKHTYRGYDLYAPSGLNWGVPYIALTLKTLENWTPDRSHHYSTSAPDLETLVRVTREVDEEDWMLETKNLDNTEFLEAKLSTQYAETIWKRAQKKRSNTGRNYEGSHSYEVAIIDSEGNAITGLHTIEAYPWADGYFVEGVPLNNAGTLNSKFFYGTPGGRILTATGMHLTFEKTKLKFVTGSFSRSTLLAEIQFLVNLIDYKTSSKDAVTLPRFGNRMAQKEGQPLKNSISPRVNAEVLKSLEDHGIYLEPATSKNGQDTGLGTVAVIREDNSKEGAFAPLKNR